MTASSDKPGYFNFTTKLVSLKTPPPPPPPEPDAPTKGNKPKARAKPSSDDEEASMDESRPAPSEDSE